MKMQAVYDLVKPLETLVPYSYITVSDNLMSDVWFKGSFDKKETWANDIFHNSRYFMFFISPPKGTRWYVGGDVCVELSSCGFDTKFRKYTGTPEKVVAKIKEWITKQTSN